MVNHVYTFFSDAVQACMHGVCTHKQSKIIRMKSLCSKKNSKGYWTDRAPFIQCVGEIEKRRERERKGERERFPAKCYKKYTWHMSLSKKNN